MEIKKDSTEITSNDKKQKEKRSNYNIIALFSVFGSVIIPIAVAENTDKDFYIGAALVLSVLLILVGLFYFIKGLTIKIPRSFRMQLQTYTPEYKILLGKINIFNKETITRLEFFVWTILIPILFFILCTFVLFNLSITGDDYATLVSSLTFIVIIVTYIVGVTKRCRDINKPKMVWFAFIPPINFYIYLYLLVKEGRKLKY
ncbi:hypothetical protein A2331_04765 [Candidatus Falkowbacteria bacterium RIFOXYB2_FULL_34_18]|uniref:Uncharacterized protein n=1 Tax=Candidatus Falkowbacteria bacterium RIFOXYD2_FULL_34_120 TaxID=1798007 RepID=A0A1F5TQ64_9BACT|nr:MAG: hypothetical protein A2331_04765 [Candidatus Falkowbacteria bacterium RIFOXYB2_FULL_34_18]OGF29372.1 MAG: hypothetical protein A2500_06350 [Candidatus Falkowbacteria bacterium RIFOXYC12_FULL_34_55]OGF36563.1 MAG: hypothetical protein A2466_07390 [Candidatus Falkowbacteria bacterium RIFOXYC2_FULL_34_220]OGF38795.1 MAG: hypothetical protein A2515_03500 [Candidatus Falkowbacteria bacterium RIFOXYD12_FULL_34_57]OGF41036.1 MAG: hypothetical protein A2531_03745 [Candidatus Falkowbacteria bact